MDHTPIVERCREMTVKELLRATTVESAQYEPAFHAAARAELSRRRLEVAEVRGMARVFLPDGSTHEQAVDTVPSLLPQDLPEGAMLGIGNCIDEMLVFQRRGSQWVIHHTSHDAVQGSWVCPVDESVQTVARRFLALEEWKSSLTQDVSPYDWVVIDPSCTMGYARRAMEALQADGIAARAVPEPVSCGGTCFRAPRYSLMVEGEDETTARAILDGFSQLVAKLHEQAEEHAARGDSEAELAAYDEILTLEPGDQVALFNKGAILMELTRHDEALECLAPLVSGADDHTLGELGGQFKAILETAPSIAVLHAMADVERRRGHTDAALLLLRDALGMDQNHAMTHLAIGYLCYEDDGYDVEAATHFRRYLELQPDADDRVVIEAMLDDLDLR